MPNRVPNINCVVKTANKCPKVNKSRANIKARENFFNAFKVKFKVGHFVSLSYLLSDVSLRVVNGTRSQQSYPTFLGRFSVYQE